MMLKASSKSEIPLLNALPLLLEVLAFICVCGAIPLATFNEAGYPTVWTFVAFMTAFCAASVAMDWDKCASFKAAERTAKPPEFKNTALSLANAALMAVMCVWGAARFASAVLAGEVSDRAMILPVFTDAVATPIRAACSLAMGYLAYDLADMQRKNLMGPLIFCHHLAAALPALLVLTYFRDNGVLLRASFVVLSCEFNSIFLHTRRLLRLSYPQGTPMMAIVESATWGSLLLFRVIPSIMLFGFHTAYCIALLIETGSLFSLTVLDAVLLVCTSAYVHHNGTLVIRMHSRRRS